MYNIKRDMRDISISYYWREGSKKTNTSEFLFDEALEQINNKILTVI